MRLSQKEREECQARDAGQNCVLGACCTGRPPPTRDQAAPFREEGAAMMHLHFNNGTGKVAHAGELNGHPR